MKVLAAVIIAPHMQASGAVNAALSLSKSIAEHCDIDIAIMSSESCSEMLGNARLIRCPTSNPLSFTQGILPNKFRTLLFKSKISELIEKNNYDVVHIHNPIPTHEMKRIAQRCVKNQIPYVVSTHGFFEVTSGGSAYRLKYLHEKLAWKYLIQEPLRYVCDNANLIFSLSPFENDILTKDLGIPVNKIRIVTNGVDPAFLQTLTSITINQRAAKYGLPKKHENSPPVCVYLGNHTTNKGIDVLLSAFQQVKRDFLLVVAGKKRGEIDYDSFQDNSKTNRKIIFTDMIADEDLPSVLQYADLFVYPTLSDTLPLVILEAMASKLPILSTKVGGIPYQVSDENGILVEADNATLVANAVDELLADKVRLRHMGQRSYERVCEQFSWDESAQLAVTQYKALLDD